MTTPPRRPSPASRATRRSRRPAARSDTFLQRKAAARGLALGLTTLAVPAVPLAVLNGQVVGAVAIVVIALLLVRGLRAPSALAWLDQE